MNGQALKEWETSEWVIERHLKKIDDEIQKFHKRAAIWGAHPARRDKFITQKLQEMIKSITEG